MGGALDSEMCLIRGIGVVLRFWKLKEKLHLEVSCSPKILETETRETINKIKKEPNNTKYNWFKRKSVNVWICKGFYLKIWKV